MNNETQNGAFITKDWHTILFLIACNVGIIDTRRAGERCVEFKFSDPDECVRLRENLLMGRETELEFDKVMMAIKRARYAVRQTDNESWLR